MRFNINSVDPDGRLRSTVAAATSIPKYDNAPTFNNQVKYSDFSVTYSQPARTEREQVSALLDVLPVIGVFKAGIEAVSGRDLITGRDLSVGERISRVAAVTISVGSVAYAAVATNAARTGASRTSTQATSNLVGRRQSSSLDSVVSEGEQCFPAGTLILMADGTSKKIEDIAVDDEVWADNPEDQCPARGQKVVRLFRNQTSELIRLTLDENLDGKVDSELQVTGEHPLWTSQNRWIAASDLSHIDYLVNRLNQRVRVLTWETIAANCEVYNFEVQDTHTYFVGSGNVLSHNSCRGAFKTPNSSTPVNLPANTRGSNNPNTRAASSRGSTAHSDQPGHLPDQLRNEYPETEFEFVRPGTSGQDVRVVGGLHPSFYPYSQWPKGVNHADFKPNTASGLKTFNRDQRTKWIDSTHQLRYDPATGKLINN